MATLVVRRPDEPGGANRLIPRWAQETLGWDQDLFPDIGEYCAGTQFVHDFQFPNVSRSTLQIVQAEIGCVACSSVSLDRYRIAPGESFTVTIQGTTSERVGYEERMRIDGRVFFAGRREPLRLGLRLTAFRRTPVVIELGTIPPDEEHQVTFLVRDCDGRTPSVAFVKCPDPSVSAELGTYNGTSPYAVPIRLTVNARGLSGGEHISRVQVVFREGDSESSEAVPIRFRIEGLLRCEPSVISVGPVTTEEWHAQELVVWSTRGIPFRVRQVASDMPGFVSELRTLDSDGARHAIQIRFDIPQQPGTVGGIVEIQTDHSEWRSLQVPIYVLRRDVPDAAIP